MVKPEAEAETAPLPARQRKWHPRVFTGCVNCRRRHVKCDERTPSCTNCTRLSLACNFDRRFVFKAVRPSGGGGGGGGGSSRRRPATATARRRKTARRRVSAGSTSSNNEDDDDDEGEEEEEEEEEDEVEDEDVDDEEHSEQMTPTSMAPVPSAFVAAASPLTLPSPMTDCRDGLYYHHFLHTVSSYLIIYDTPANANPYRRLLPQLIGGGAGLLLDAMRALGAMHLSGLPGVQDRRLHRNTAVRTYASVVTRLRDAVSTPHAQADLELLATSLLLCMLEQMSSADASWKIHLVGAGQIFHSLYSPRTGSPPAGIGGTGGESCTMLPLRRFLVSTMSYLDVAAACATGGGPLIAGDYWETLGGGWEYNLGATSLFHSPSSTVHRTMAQLRSSWSRVMSIQTDISRFAKLLRSGLDRGQSEMFRNDIGHRIRNWHDSVPDLFLRLDEEEAMTIRGNDYQHVETLTAAACILSYALACTIYLERVVSRRVGSAVFDPIVRQAVDRILRLVDGFSRGVHRLAMLWAILTGGIATVDTAQQCLLRQWLTEMKSFGFKHVSRVLDTLEWAWQYGDYDELEVMISSNLVP